MSVFSDNFQQLLKQKNISIYSLAKISDVERSYIQKMKSGDRLPADETVIERLSIMMSLTPTEAEHFKLCYNISKLGENIYYRRKHVEDIIKNLSKTNLTSNNNVLIKHSNNLDMGNKIVAVRGNYNINNLLKTILEIESEHENPMIKLIAQTEYKFLWECLTQLGIQHDNMYIDHIVCINNNDFEEDNRYNLDIFNTIMPLTMTCCDYNPFYYYDNAKAHINDLSNFPYLIITSDYVIQISWDIEYAILYSTDEVSNIHKEYFNSFKEKCSRLIERANDGEAVLKYYNKITEIKGEVNPDFTIQMQPCLAAFLEYEFIKKYANTDIPGVDFLISNLTTRGKQFREEMATKPITVFTTKNGVLKFMETGMISELPVGVYFPPIEEDRYYLLNEVYRHMQNGTYKLYLLKEIPDLDNLTIACYDEYLMTFSLVHPTRGMILLSIQEKSMTFSVYDYVASLSGTNAVLSDEETNMFMKKLLER